MSETADGRVEPVVAVHWWFAIRLGLETGQASGRVAERLGGVPWQPRFDAHVRLAGVTVLQRATAATTET
jgi:hypothetical protein